MASVVLVVRAASVQHVVEQRHRVGAGRRIGDLHREQRVPRGPVVAVSVLLPPFQL